MSGLGPSSRSAKCIHRSGVDCHRAVLAGLSRLLVNLVLELLVMAQN
jgi:hypothetical protein